MRNSMRRRAICALALFVVMVGTVPVRAGEDADDEVLARVNAKVKDIQAWAADPVIVRAVRARNESTPEAERAMNQQTWKTLSVLDPFVRRFTKNEVGLFLKSKKDATVSEAFVSAADGAKVGFLTKPTNWIHLGKPKHDRPMKGEIWRGPIEVDESTGVQQMQVAVPILDDEGKAIGSLVVGLDVSKLKP